MKLHTKLPLEELLQRLDISMNSLNFEFNSDYCQQIDGLPIGLSLSPISADLVLKYLEEDYLLKERQ